MSQPTWKNLWSTDCLALCVDETGVYPPKLAVLEEYETKRGTTRYQLYRVSLERQAIVEVTDDDDMVTHRYLVPASIAARRDNLSHPIRVYEEWYVKDLAGIADTCDTTRDAIVAELCSEDPSHLAMAYDAIAGYHGWENFDSGPVDLTPSDVKNWPDLDGKPEITISTNDDDDGTITLYCDDVEAARDAQCVLGSHWECPGDMDTAYAGVMNQADLVTALESEGYDVDAAEWSPPDDEDFRFWSAKYERANGAAPERLREILGWSGPDDVAKCRRVVDQASSWWTGPEREAFRAACFTAGRVLDGEEWAEAYDREHDPSGAIHAHDALAEDAEKVGRP